MGDDGSDTHAASVSIGAGGGGSRARSPAAPAKARIIYNSKSNSCESFDVMLSFPLSVSVGTARYCCCVSLLLTSVCLH